MEDMRDSTTAQPQIVKIVKMVIKFHPLLMLTYLIFCVMFMQDWIEEVSNQWKILKVYCQSTIRALLDPFTEKMMNLSEALQMHLNNKAAKGQLKAKLIGRLALFTATFLLLHTEFSSKYDKRGAKVQLLLMVGLELLTYSNCWSQLRILRRRCSWLANSTSNFTLFIIALPFAKFYDNSLRSLSVVFCIAVFLLCVLVVLRPRTDLGLFSFIIGVIGSITYNRFEYKFPTWIIAFVCFVLFNFKSWLDKYWLDLEQNQSLTSTNSTVGSTSVFLILASTAVHIAQGNFWLSVAKSPMSDCKYGLVTGISALIWSVRYYKFYPDDRSLPSSTNTKQITGLILTIVSVAQGLFWYALVMLQTVDCKFSLFVVISFVVFCFWLQRFLPKNLSPPSTNTKGITGMILSLQSIATYGFVVLVGWEPSLYYNEWLALVICYVLWWVQSRRSFPNLLLSAEFKAPQWRTVVVTTMIADVIPWIQLSRTTHHQQQG